jgi:hypothetical protein
MNKEQIKLDKDTTITVTAVREESARCRWSICVFTSVGSIRTMHVNDIEAFKTFIEASAVLGKLVAYLPLINAVHKVTNNELFSIEGMHEYMDAPRNSWPLLEQ